MMTLLEQGKEPWVVEGWVGYKKSDPRKAKAGGNHQCRNNLTGHRGGEGGTAGMVFGNSL